MKKIIRVWNYLRYYGWKLFLLKMTRKFPAISMDYVNWRKQHLITEEEYEQQKSMFSGCDVKISIVVPAYKTPKKFLCEMIESVLNQTYSNWELCIADGSENADVAETVSNYAQKDKRIRYQKLEQNLGIADNTNAALHMATGTFIGLLDHDDILAREALFEIVKQILMIDQVDVIYTDEDKVTVDLQEYFDPHFKPDFNPELLRSNNYICHFFLVRKEILTKVHGFCKEYEGAQDYDFILRCTECARKVAHIPKPLYHWRTHKDSTAENPESKLYAYESGKRAIEAHLVRSKESGIVEYMNDYGFYHVTYPVTGHPKVSAAVLDTGSARDLNRCKSAFKMKKAGYEVCEILVRQTITDFMFEQMTGDYVLLINSAVQMKSNNWLRNMLGCCQREQQVAVSGRLNYPDETIRHAGIIEGMNGYAFEGFSRVQYGYFHRESLQQNLSGVTFDLMLISKNMISEIQKTDPLLLEDEVKTGRMIRSYGKRIVYDPKVEGYYYGSTDKTYYKSCLEPEHDPYYNENLSLRTTFFELDTEVKGLIK